MQTYKIYINTGVLILKQSADILDSERHAENVLVALYLGKIKELFHYVDLLEKGSKYAQVVLHYDDFKVLKRDVKSIFKIIPAGGGVVENEKEELLFIFRKGYWDLPKGKLDPGEQRKDAALREVEEETGVQGLKRYELITKSKHVYKIGTGKRMLKITNWYRMTAPNQPLVPQAEEQITDAQWLSVETYEGYGRQATFDSISEVIQIYKKEKGKK